MITVVPQREGIFFFILKFFFVEREGRYSPPFVCVMSYRELPTKRQFYCMRGGNLPHATKEGERKKKQLFGIDEYHGLYDKQA